VRAARRLRAGCGRPPPRWGRRPAPFLLFLTDPERTPHPEAVVERLPRGAAVVFRAFGHKDAAAEGRRLKAAARRRGLLLLVGADPRLALAIGADGVHLPERLAHRAGALRRARPGWVVTAAAHGRPALLKAARAGAHAVLVSPVFESRSSSAGRPLTVLGLAALVRSATAPAYALGGVNGATAKRLAGSGAAGIAAVEALARAVIRT
jgi:thiamine-phosphate pyrophosphorylase